MDTSEGVQKLHAEIESDEDFEKFLEREGLLVMDVYAEWCGPCISMSSSLEKLKLDVAGDNLHLAKCKSDKIKRLEKFRNTCKPTWLIASHNKLVNCLSGANMPVLMDTIIEELELEEKYKAGDYERNFYDWNNLPSNEDLNRQNKCFTKSDGDDDDADSVELTMADYIKTQEILENVAHRGDTREP